MKIGKWIGAGLGWTFGGVIGGIIGFAIGSLFDKTEIDSQQGFSGFRNRQSTTASDFTVCILILSASVMKADGKVLKSELDYIKQFFVRQFGVEKTKQIMFTFKGILEKEINLYEVCSQMNYFMPRAEKLQMLHYLFGIANADGTIHKNELYTINTISNLLNIPLSDFESIKAMFIKDTNSAYKILEIDPSATDDEVKKAYRKMAIKYHPDKVTHLGSEHQEEAKKKFQKLNDAYNAIKKERNFN